MTRANWIHRLPGFLLMALGAGIGVLAGSFPELEEGHPGPGLFPMIVAIGLGGCGLVLSVRPGSPEPETATPPSGWPGRGRFIAGLVLTAAFPALHAGGGFFLAMAVLSLAIALMLGARWQAAVLTALAASAAIYLLFTQLLGVPL